MMKEFSRFYEFFIKKINVWTFALPYQKHLSRFYRLSRPQGAEIDSRGAAGRIPDYRMLPAAH
jgi:hypothetical protein